MNRILVPIDFSPASISAWKTALYFARIFRAAVRVIHVCPKGFWEPYMPLLLETALREQREEEAKTAFGKWLDKWSVNGVIEIQHDLLYGDVDQTILRVAKDWKADLLVMGNKKDIQLKKKWLGSTVAAVLKKCEQEVLIVPDGKEINSIGSMTFAMSFEEERVEAIESVLLFSGRIGSRLTCLNIHKKKQEEKGIPKAEILKRAYKQELKEGLIQFDSVIDNDFEEGVKKYLHLHPADLLVLMGEESDGLFNIFSPQSQAEELVGSNQLPVWVLPNQHAELGQLIQGWNKDNY
ncbi:MAG: universal stress protein [Bacteroidia bacterium]|nr:universal stress protein [Bacteroidia bacterium]